MNSIQGHIANLEVSGNLTLVTVSFSDTLILKAIVIETPESAPYLMEGNRIQLMFKETEVVIGTFDEHQVSLQNRIPGTISEIENGRLLSRVLIHTEVGIISAVISRNSTEQLRLKTGKKVWAMVKLNEVMLSE